MNKEEIAELPVGALLEGKGAKYLVEAHITPHRLWVRNLRRFYADRWPLRRDTPANRFYSTAAWFFDDMKRIA